MGPPRADGMCVLSGEGKEKIISADGAKEWVKSPLKAYRWSWLSD